MSRLLDIVEGLDVPEAEDGPRHKPTAVQQSIQQRLSLKKLLTALVLITLLVTGSVYAATDYKIVNKGGTADPVTMRVFTLGGSWTSVWEATPTGQFRLFDSMIIKGRSSAPALSGSNELTMYYDTVIGGLRISFNGSSYGPIGAGSSVSTDGLNSTTTTVNVSSATAPSTGQVLTATDSTHAAWQTPSSSASANALNSATTVVNVSSATAPSNGQVLMATDSTHATWQTPSAGSSTATALSTSGAAVNVNSAAPPNAGDRLTATDATHATWQTPTNGVYPITVPPDHTSLTWVGQGGATADNTGGNLNITFPGSSTFLLHMLTTSIPSAPYTFTVALMPQITKSNYSVFGIVLRDSASGKVVTFHITASSGGFTFAANKYTNETTFSGPYSVQDALVPGGLIWLQAKDDNTNRTYLISGDGYHWTQIYSGLRTDFITPNQIGVFVDSESTSAFGSVSFLSWSFTSPTVTSGNNRFSDMLATYVDPPSTGWSWVNQGTATVSSGSNYQSIISGSTSSGDKVNALCRSVGLAAPFTLTAALNLNLAHGSTSTSSFLAGGIGLMDSGSGKITTPALWDTLVGADGGTIRLQWVDWTNSTTPSASAITHYIHGAAAQKVVWFRMQDTSTNLVYQYSSDGVNWLTVRSTAYNAFLPNHADTACFFIDVNTPTASDAAVATLRSWTLTTP